MRVARWALAIAVTLAAWGSVPRPAGAYIEEMYTLKKMIDECTHVYTAKITAVDKVKRRVSIKLIDPLKGKTSVKKVNFNLGQPQYEWQAAFACSDLTEGQQAILFWKEDGPGDMKSLLFANGYFLQNVGGYDVNNLDNIWIPFTHIEIRMNRTFCGTTVQFLTLLRAHLQENKPLPAPKATVPEWTKERMQAKKKEEKVDFEDPAAVKKAVELLAAAQGAVPKQQIGTGTGLKGEYYDNPDFTNLKVTRVDPEVKFEWNGGEAAPGVAAETFSARWTGQIQAKSSETWTFYTNSDDGVRLWVNGKKLVDNWTDHAPTVDSGTIDLKAGEKVDLKLEFFQGGGPCCIILMWSSESQEQEVIPRTQLYPPAGGAAPVPAAAAAAPPK
jgi:hypothetical protein